MINIRIKWQQRQRKLCFTKECKIQIQDFLPTNCSFSNESTPQIIYNTTIIKTAEPKQNEDNNTHFYFVIAFLVLMILLICLCLKVKTNRGGYRNEIVLGPVQNQNQNGVRVWNIEIYRRICWKVRKCWIDNQLVSTINVSTNNTLQQKLIYFHQTTYKTERARRSIRRKSTEEDKKFE